MRLEPTALAILLLVCCASALAAEASAVYCCDDGAGHRICGNPMPQQCYSRAYKELSRGGRTVREVAAPLTPVERAHKDAADKARREAEARIAERGRRDRVLLESYNSVGEIDERRDSVVRGAEKEIETLKRRETELVAARSGKPDIQDDPTANAAELNALRGVIAQKQRDAETLRKRFADDRQRYVELNGKPASVQND